MNKIEEEDIHEKIKRGVQLAYRRLIEQKQREDGELVYSINGKIVHVRARDIELEPLDRNEQVRTAETTE